MSLFRLLLPLYPPGCRRRFRHELEAVFEGMRGEDRYRGPGGG